METTVYVALITGTSTLSAGVVAAALSGYFSRRVARDTLEREFRLRELDFRIAERKRKIEAFEHLYAVLCSLQRDFSLAAMNSELDAKISVEQWDINHRESCRNADSARAKSVLLGASCHDAMEEAYSSMGNYWGVFRHLIRMDRGPNDSGPDFPPFKSAYAASCDAFSKLGKANEAAVQAIREENA